MGEPDGNHKVGFCRGAPAPTVVRVHVHAGSDAAHLVEVERVYGAPATTTGPMAQRFATMAEDETLLVALASDGRVLGTAWPVFRDNVSLQGFPDMSEAEAAGLLESPQCNDSLRALLDHGVRPASATPSGGCAHCATSGHAGSGAMTSDGWSGSLFVVLAAIATCAWLSRRARARPR